MSVKARTAGWKEFLRLCQLPDTTGGLDEILQALLTHEEISQLALRVELLRALLKGEKPQRQIASDLGVSIATITRGSNMLKTIKPKLHKFLGDELA
ncbi:MAG: trp operon repressor [Coxiella sp. (in: Bacteria)]|nr:MAG: trp operon repressor [Coxiella sp. (in: g-proteobacteria)]